MDFNFELDEDEAVRATEFMDAHETKHGECLAAIGGRYSFTFTPTGVGTCVHIKCSCGEEKDVTDYDLW